MGKINVGKVIVGGLVAGAVMNVFDFVTNTYILKNQFDAVNMARNIAPSVAMSTNAITTMVGLDFVMGLIVIFTYAAIRPRFSPGPKTAVIAAVIIALATDVLAAYFAAMGFFPWGLWLKASTLASLNMIVSGLIGGAIYSE